MNDEMYWGSIQGSNEYNERRAKKQLVSMDQPSIFELIAMPNRLEVLFEVALTRRCVKCNTGMN